MRERIGSAKISARNRFHARLLEQQQSVAGSEARLTDHVRELDRRERLDRRLRHDAFDLPDQVGVIIKVVARMHAPDDMHFGRAAVAVCLDSGEPAGRRYEQKRQLNTQTFVGSI